MLIIFYSMKQGGYGWNHRNVKTTTKPIHINPMRHFPLHYYGVQSSNRMRVLQTSWHFSCYQLVPNNCIRGKSMLLFFLISMLYTSTVLWLLIFIYIWVATLQTLLAQTYISVLQLVSDMYSILDTWGRHCINILQLDNLFPVIIKMHNKYVLSLN